MFTPIKSAGSGQLNDTILHTPQPQATSTVQRKNILESRFNSGGLNEERYKRVIQYESEQAQKREDSSLGLLDNISELANISTMHEEQKLKYPNMDSELESRVRKLLQRCSDMKDSSLVIDTNKENNVNVQNITGVLPVSNLALPIETNVPDSDRECTTTSKTNTTIVTFEPNEITARSSGLSRNSEEQFPLNQSYGGISFSSVAAEILAHCSNEKFLSSSKVAEQLSADEALWKQNYTYSMPVASTERKEFDLTAFSDIIGQTDLSIASCPGKRVSIGQYFRRKCDDIGMLWDDGKMRASLGLTSETPVRRNKLQPLIDSTVEMTNATTLSAESKEKEHTHIPNAITDANENNILSLSTIANTLQDVNSGSPRRLVDQLLMAQKRKKYPVNEENARKETYTLPLERRTMLATPTSNSNKFDEDISLVNLTKKLSLDSKSMNEVIDVKERLPKMLSFVSSGMKEAESFTNVCKEKAVKEETRDKNATSSFNQDAVQISASDLKLLQNSTLSLSVDEKSYVSSCISSEMDVENYTEEICDMSAQDVQKKRLIKEKDTFDNTIGSLFTEGSKIDIQHDLNNVVIGKNTEQLCNCIVGMTCEANIELINKGNRWITYILELFEVRGDEQNIILNIPQDSVLIKPDGAHSSKIEVKVIKMCRPIMAVLNIIILDMVAKSKWFLKHMICFKPEELELDVICDSHKQELHFQYIPENSTKVLPIVFHNRNNTDVPVKLSILQDGPKVFSIDDTFKESIKLNESRDELTDLVLKPQERFTTGIKCERSQSVLTDCSQKQPQCLKSKLIVQVQCSDGTVLLMKEVPLRAQVGTCKIQVIDTDIPIVVPRQQGKLLNIINSGNVTTRVSATVVPIEGYPNAAQDYSIKPDDISLEPGERSAFLIACKSQNSDVTAIDDERHAKIKLVAGNNVYCYIVSTEKSLESESENYIRCDTPCNMVSASSPTSPQSVTSSRSGTYGRNSPSSTVSSVAVMGNTIPIKTTHAALVWNSVRTGKSETKEFTIRNTSNNKIKLQIDIWDDSKSFKFLGDRQTVNTSMVLAMQRTESKTLAITFSPYHVGPVAGKITIRHYMSAREGGSESQQHKRIPLYGYGGYGKVKISDTFKDASGKMWLSLGTLSSGTKVLRTNIKLQNTGDLRSFAKIKVVPKVISPTMSSSWHVNPKELILNPKEARRVPIEFHPKKEDYAILQRSDVSHVATINIIYGDEPTRWRIRRLYNKMKESGELAGDENDAFKSIVHPICKTFSDEQLIPSLTSIRDSVQNLSDLCTGVHQNEIMLTVEACADDTLLILHDSDDESQMYYSLISDNSHIDEAGGASFFASQTMKGYGASHYEPQDEHFIVTPSTVILNPPIYNEATVTILSYFKVAQQFQVCLSDSSYLSVVPAEGMLPSKRNFPLKIQCSQRIERNMQAILEIYTENNKQDVLIKVNVKRH